MAVSRWTNAYELCCASNPDVATAHAFREVLASSAWGFAKVKRRPEALIGENADLAITIKQHLEDALELMDKLCPSSALAARCQELIDGLNQLINS